MLIGYSFPHQKNLSEVGPPLTKYSGSVHAGPEVSLTMQALQRALVSVIITLLNNSECSLNKKWLRPVTIKSNPPLVGNQSETPFFFQFKLFHFIYPHKETYIVHVLPKIESENTTKTHHYFGSLLGISGNTPIDLNSVHLQAPWRALVFREKAFDSTLSARIGEHASGLAK